MFSVSSRTSAKIGVAPQWTITFALAGQVIELVITSSPGPTPSATSERWSAAVHDETASTWLASRYSRIRASSSAVRGPVVSHPERRVAATASISASEIAGGWNERKDDRLDESSGIRGHEAYSLGSGVRTRDGLLARVADREHGAGPVGATAKRREDVAWLAVAADALDPFERLRHLDALEHAGRSDEEAGDGAADPVLVPTGVRNVPSAASIARPFRSTPVTASTSSASWPPPSRAATSITCGPSGPRRSCVYVGPFSIPSADAARAATSSACPCVVARPDVRQSDAEGGRLGDDAVGDDQAREDTVGREADDGHLRAVDELLDEGEPVASRGRAASIAAGRSAGDSTSVSPF